MKYVIHFFLCLFFCLEIKAQNVNLDSLIKLANSTHNDTAKIRLYGLLCNACQVEDNPKYAIPLIELADKVLSTNPNAHEQKFLHMQQVIAYDAMLWYAKEKKDCSSKIFENYAKPYLKITDLLLAENSDSTERKLFLQYKVSAYDHILSLYRMKGDTNHLNEYYTQGISFFKKMKYSDGIYACVSQIARYYHNQGNIAKELEYYANALADARKRNDKQSIAIFLVTLSDLYNEQDENEQAKVNNQEALSIYKELKDTNNIAKMLRELGYTYGVVHDTAKALDFFKDATKIYNAHNNLEELRLTYNMMGLMLAAHEDYSNALFYYEKSMAISEVLPDKTFLRANLGNIGDIYRKQGKFEKALFYHFKSLKVARSIESKVGQIGWVWQQLAKDYLALNDCKTAKKYIDSALAVTINAEGYLELKMNAELDASKIDSCCGNFKEAYLHYSQYNYWREKLKNDDVKKAAIKQNFQDAYDRLKTKDKEEQEKKDVAAKERIHREKIIRNYLIGIIIIVLLFSIAVIRQRNKIKIEQQISEELLLNILPAETAEELKSTGKAKAKNYKDVTVMFTDFKNFSQASEKLSAEDLVHEINYLYSSFDTIISNHKIEKIKTIGDSYMAASGLPIENKTHAEDTVHAAREIQQFMVNYNQEKLQHGKPIFEIRIGIHTGPVVAGIVGIKKFAYDIWGDTVNIASRMESSGEAGKINISGTTFEIVKDRFVCEYRGKIEAKNKGEIDMYFVNL